MRGKSMTCRPRSFFALRVFDPSDRSETGGSERESNRKSETCRASVWHSQGANRVILNLGLARGLD